MINKNYEYLETEDCFEPLRVVNGTEVWKINTHRRGVIGLSVQLPEGKTCERCILRWHWKSGI